ncbi:MAG: PAS domain-containing protein [Methanoregula sp.]|jgi:PAS domain S-box-containing protein|uniref:PAS domain S-box protein n=1 Tax=Methanoregula sp. TaxID=2052170 RepID=UPI003C16049B
MDRKSKWWKTPGLDPRMMLILTFMGMFALTGVFELGGNLFLQYFEVWQASLLTMVVVSAGAAFIAFFPIRSLRTAEARLDTLLNGSPSPQFVIDADHRIIFWNRALEIASGIKLSDVYGTTDSWRAFYAAQRPTLADLLVDGMVEKIPEWYKGWITRSQIIDGSYEAIDFFPQVGKNGSWFYFTASPVRDDKGVIIGAVESFIDVTRRKRAEEVLEANKLLIEDSMELAHMAYWEFDVPTGMFIFNNRFYTLYGTTAAREGGYRMSADAYVKNFVHPDDVGLVQAQIAKSQVIQGPGTLSELEHRIIRRDGEIRYIRACIRTTRDETGRMIRSNGSNQDITERRQAEIAHKESEERYRAVVEDQTEFISRFLPDGTHVFVNDAYCRYFGLNREEIIGHRFRPEIPAEDQERVKRLFASLTPDHPVDSIEHRIIMPDGALRWQWWSDRAIFDSSGAIAEYQSVGQDITERKQAEIALKESGARFLTFIKEAAMRLKTPLEVVEGNLAGVVEDVEKGDVICADISLQLKLQIKDLEQIRKNITELNKGIVDRSGELSEASKKFLTE